MPYIVYGYAPQSKRHKKEEALSASCTDQMDAGEAIKFCQAVIFVYNY